MSMSDSCIGCLLLRKHWDDQLEDGKGYQQAEIRAVDVSISHPIGEGGKNNIFARV